MALAAPVQTQQAGSHRLVQGRSFGPTEVQLRSKRTDHCAGAQACETFIFLKFSMVRVLRRSPVVGPAVHWELWFTHL
jgi:hypothetical protein